RGATALPVASAASGPAMVSRAGWGADESLRRGSPYYMSQLKASTVHHSAGSNSYTQSEAPAVVRGIYAYHTGSLGWSDIGYNFVVDRYGTIYEGRAGGTAANVMGAHAGGFNTYTFGVSVMGEFTATAPPLAARRAVARVIAWKFGLNGLSPDGSATLTSAGSTRYPAGQVVTLPTIHGHRDVSATACPGSAFYAGLPRLREMVASRMEAAAPQPEPSPTAHEAPELLVASSPARVDTTALDGATLRGPAHIWSAWDDEAGTRRVSFWLDRSTDQAPDRVETSAPYEWPGVDTTTLANGDHRLVSKVELTDGTVLRTVASFALDNPAPGPAFTWRVNAGGPALVAPNGTRWAADQRYDGGKAWTKPGASIRGTRFDALYRSQRFGLRGYHVPVPAAGRYTVRVRLAEIYYDRVGRRVFGVRAEGQTLAGRLDLVKLVGRRRAYDLVATVPVLDGKLDITFRRLVENPTVAGISVVSAGPVLMRADGADHARSRLLKNRTLSATPWLWTSWAAAAHTERVDFWIDDPDLTGAPDKTEWQAPYDFGRLDTRRLSDGPHTLTVRLERKQAPAVIRTVAFRVSN
ncbi:MAG: N-acetylmuramoyl-L-alanine amidase, partial [Euzebyales bacterium]|nr:N-acetylmuramoyl-L-alanine amidase [Euzebyales bacterium]MBA3622090.1 N-acetylmuramoyl-L-alanine amidase [Euzebyales bacterium]